MVVFYEHMYGFNMFRYAGTLFLVYLSSVSGAPLEDLATRESHEAEPLVVDGIDVTKLSEEDQVKFADAEDEILVGELDLESGKQQQQLSGERRALPLIPLGVAAVRLAPHAFRAGRMLYKTIRTAAKPKFSKGKITRNYFSGGNMKDAYKNFNRLTGGNYKKIDKGGLRGQMGKHQVILRQNSGKGGRGPPTLEIQTPNYRSGVTKYRKFRFDGGRG